MTLFLAVDGDKVGSRLEALIVAEELERVASFSLDVVKAIRKMTELIEQKHGILVFAGGDNLLATFDEVESRDLDVEELGCALMRIFLEATNCTISIGIGCRPRDAFLALKLAKGSKTKLVHLR
jgi:GTP cyclohydrolase III